jgi:hypothetical protein
MSNMPATMNQLVNIRSRNLVAAPNDEGNVASRI